MKRLIIDVIVGILVVLSGTSAAFCEEVLREVSWAKLKEAGQLTAGQLIPGRPPGPAEQLKIENAQTGPSSVHILTLDKPGVTSSRYAVTGQVRYENVAAKSYLEMWSWSHDGKKYFSRTLASRGVLKRLEGSSDWRPFSLPFVTTEGTARPTKLEVNLVLAGRGTVYLGPLRLVQYAPGEDLMAVPGSWWSDRMGGLIGGGAGAILGCLGGLIGILAAAGKARRLVMSLVGLITWSGAAVLAVGLIALVQSQPYAVYYPLLLLGGLSLVVMAPMRRTLRLRYEQLELRKMKAMDLGPAETPDWNTSS